MSFRCSDCGDAKGAGQLIVRETREKTYYEKRLEKGREIEVAVGAGFETVREERVCTDCIEKQRKQ